MANFLQELCVTFFFVKIKLMSINWLKVIKHLSAKAKCEVGKDHKLQVSLQGVADGTTSVGKELC